MGRRGVVVGALLIAVAGLSAACRGAPAGGDHVAIGVDAPVALADRAVHVRLSGLAAGDEVTVTATAADYRQRRWRGWANFRADDRGRVDLDRARPISGTYSGVDGMGLFWSMHPPSGDAAHDTFLPPYPDSRQPAYQVRLSVTAPGRRPAQRTLTRQWLAAGVTRRTFTVRADKISGELFLPPRGTPRHPGVLVFGGSEGGTGGLYDAALLASHGYPALTLAYFRAPGLPPALRDIPLEYFARAARVLAAQPGVDPAHVVVRGYSRGTEAALLLGQYYPGLIHGVIVYAPGAEVSRAFPDGAGDAWTRGGRPIGLGTIPLDHINGPLLAIAGTDDELWPAEPSSTEIMAELDRAHDRFPHEALIYPGAGHGVGTFPYLASGTRLRHPVTGEVIDLGGSRPADAAARAHGWPKVLGLLAGLDR